MATIHDATKIAPRFINHSDKECLRKFHVIALIDGALFEVMNLGIYSGRSTSATTIYADFHVYGLGQNDIYAKGNGKASGGGYNKEGAASDEAITAAGFSGFQSTEAGGIERTLRLIANEFGYDVVKVVC